MGIRTEELCDIPILAPFVNESELEHGCINAIEREDVFVCQSFPDRCLFPKDLLCFQEILSGIDAKGLEGHLLVAPNTTPDVCGSARCNSNLSSLIEPFKRSSGFGKL